MLKTSRMLKMTPARIALAALCVALINIGATLILLWTQQRASEQTLSPGPTATPIVNYTDREWLQIGQDGYFKFSPEEWKAICAAYSNKIYRDPSTGLSSVRLAQGEVVNADEATFERVRKFAEAVVRTNTVWVYR